MIITPGEIKDITNGTIIHPVSYYHTIGYLPQLHQIYNFKEVYHHPNNFFVKFIVRPGVNFLGLQVYKRDGSVNTQKLSLALQKLKSEKIKLPGVFCYFKQFKELLDGFDDDFILLEFPTEKYHQFHASPKIHFRKLDVIKNAQLPFL